MRIFVSTFAGVPNAGPLSLPLGRPPRTTRLVVVPLAVVLLSSTALAQTFTRFGGDATGGSAGALAIGNSTFSTSAGSIAIGSLGSGGSPTTAAGPDSMAIGNGATSPGSSGVALGTRAQALNDGAFAAGLNAVAGVAGGSGMNDLAIGNGAVATGGNSVSAGTGANVSGASSVGLGHNALGTGLESVAAGFGAWATGAQSTAIGRAALASAINSTAVGNGTSAAGNFSTAIGYASTAGANGSSAFGDRANAAGTGAVSVGRNSTANQTGTVAIGDNASATGTNAIALGANSLASGALVIGGNAAGAGGSIVIGDNGNALNVVQATAVGVNTSVGVNGGVALGAGAASNRTLSPATGNAFIINGAHGTVPLGFNTTDKVLAGAVSFGNGTEYRQVTNVADGQNPLDATNVRQLRSGLQGATNYTDAVAANLQTQITTNETNIDINRTNITNLTSEVARIDKTYVAYVADAAGNPTNEVRLVGANDGNPVKISNVAAGVARNDAANKGQVDDALRSANTYTDTKVGDLDRRAVQYVTVNGKTTSRINLASDEGGPVVIHNLAPGVLANDAVNVQQLRTAVARANDGAVQYDRTPSGARTNTVTLRGGNPAAPVKIRNVAAGVAPNDAVNLQQMQSANASTLKSAMAYTDQRVNNLVGIWDRKIRAIDNRVTDVSREARSGTALALAASGLRYNDAPGKTTIAGATGVYRGQVGLAFGLGHTSDDGRWRMNAALTASPTARKPTIGAVFGASFTLN